MKKIVKHQAATFFLLILLLGSWGWFYVSQSTSISKSNLAAIAQSQNNYKNQAVKNTLRKHAIELQKPWLDYLAMKPNVTQGSLEVDWQIDPQGKVEEPNVVFSDFPQDELGESILKILGTIRFPPPPFNQKIYMSHLFKFEKE